MLVVNFQLSLENEFISKLAVSVRANEVCIPEYLLVDNLKLHI